MPNCVNCSAPLVIGNYVCDYCGTFNDIDLADAHISSPVDHESDRLCPQCTTKLQTIDLDSDGTLFIERCTTCLGMFFDCHELEAYLEKNVTPPSGVDFSKLNKITANQDYTKRTVVYRKCPVCGELMHRNNFGARSGIIVDRCKKHGVWVDGGELKRIVEWKKAGGEILDKKRMVEKEKEQQRRVQEKRLEQEAYNRKAMQEGRADSFTYTNMESSLVDDITSFIFRLFT